VTELNLVSTQEADSYGRLHSVVHHAMKTYWENGGIAPRVLNVGARWRWVVSFMSRPLYPRNKSSW